MIQESDEMKVTDVKTFTTEGGMGPWIFVQVYTDEGITGVGEATNFPGGRVVETAVNELKPYIVGKNPFNVEKLWQETYRNFFYIGISGAVISAISGIEIALWDIIGKKLNVPLFNLLGGCCYEKIKLYANNWFARADFTPEVYAARASEIIKQEYTALKFDPFRANYLNRSIPRADERLAIEMVKMVRDAVGENVDIAIDAHGAFNVTTAIRLARKLEKYDILFFEEPVPPENLSAMNKVAAAVDVPICTGERLFTRQGFRELIEKNVADIIMPDVVRTGGILETKKIAAMAETHYIPVAPHNPNGPIATLASAHLMTSTPNFLILEFMAIDVPWRDEVITYPLKIKNGYIELPDKPGLGAELDLEAIKKHPYKELVTPDWRYGFL